MANTDITAFSRGGELVVDSRLIAERLGIEHKNFLENIERYKNDITQAFGLPLLKTEAVKKKGYRGVKHLKYYLLTENQIKFLISRSRQKLDLKTVERFSCLGMDFSMYIGPKLKRKKRGESSYSNELANKSLGQREVKTLAGNIDVLTCTQIIEVKAVKQWKAALGQVLVYSHYYPSHEKRIHLYGETQESFLEMIKNHCEKFSVVVTWEA
ncbi:MAG: Rha family transcriptional regulator [Leptolyngbyaceae cyanobacterium]